jgi:hypothetical protein
MRWRSERLRHFGSLDEESRVCSAHVSQQKLLMNSDSRARDRFASVLLLLVSMAVGTASAQVNITKLPYNINKPGRYQLYSSLTYNGIGNAITINASDVSLDLRGKIITGNRTVALTNETAAIFATGRSNITIQNGTIRNFFRGIYIEGTSGNHIL